ncbi:MAG: hypothetical protein QXG00_05845 [Candidatus Woesearchaeota archaeon]
MYRTIIILILLYLITFTTKAQNKFLGSVTFISSQNVYVKFNSTEFLNLGDTLFNFSDSKPAAIVKFKSSTSIACQKLIPLNIGDSLFFVVKVERESIQVDNSKNNVDSIKLNTINETPLSLNQLNKRKDYRIRMSLQSYGDINNIKNSNRYRYSFNFQKKNFLSEQLDFESYFILNYNMKTNSKRKDLKDLLKIYSLNIDYKISENHSLIIGRGLIPFLYSIGSLDGLQYMYKTKMNTIGVVVGSRPDYRNYWFQPQLFEVGLFLSRIDSIESSSILNTISFVEQTNNLKPDRRYLYFQHQNNLIPLTNFFFSSEIDFYLVNKGKTLKKLNFSSIYSVLTLSPAHFISFNISYDSRRNVYFLETFKNSIDSLLENELRQGFRVATTLRPFSILFLNFQYSQREISKDARKTKNFSTMVGLNNIPLINSNISLGYFNYSTTFINGKNYSIFFTKNLFKDLILTGNFKLYQFNNLNSNNLFIDRFLEIGFFFNLFENLSISLNFEKKLNYEKSNYLMIDLTNRF